MPITHVSDTAKWVAVYRAMESERPDAIFHDPFARRLAGEHGEQIVQGMRHGASAAWSMVVRTAVFDELILEAIARDQIDCVVNLAAGLDARPFRLALPHALRWVDVDFQEILDYKWEVLKRETAACRYETAPTDLTDGDARRALLARIAEQQDRVLVVAEGLLIYLAPEESSKFFEASGWREAEFRSSWHESKRLNRQMRGAWLWGLFALLQTKKGREQSARMAGIVRLGRAW